MDTQSIYHLALVTHIIGLTLMAGATVTAYIAFKQFWKAYALDNLGAVTIQQAISKFSKLFSIGILLLILSGITMMGITNGVFGEQLWFRIKFALVILVIINGLIMGMRQGVKLRKFLASHTNDSVQAQRLKRNLNVFHISQMALFFIIYILSVFKFN